MTTCPHCGGAIALSAAAPTTPAPPTPPAPPAPSASTMLFPPAPENEATHWHSTVMTFGKYKGCTVEHLLVTDPKYLLWVSENVEFVTFEDSLLDDIIFAASQEPQYESSRPHYGNSPSWLSHNIDDLDDDVPF